MPSAHSKAPFSRLCGPAQLLQTCSPGHSLQSFRAMRLPLAAQNGSDRWQAVHASAVSGPGAPQKRQSQSGSSSPLLYSVLQAGWQMVSHKARLEWAVQFPVAAPLPSKLRLSCPGAHKSRTRAACGWQFEAPSAHEPLPTPPTAHMLATVHCFTLSPTMQAAGRWPQSSGRMLRPPAPHMAAAAGRLPSAARHVGREDANLMPKSSQLLRPSERQCAAGAATAC